MQTVSTNTNIKDSIATTVRLFSDTELQRDVAEAKRAVAWFEEKVKRGQKEVFSETVTMTPFIAECLRHRNLDNRNMNKNRLAEIKADLINGRWMLNGESIVISKDGYLNDGQHRVQAVIETGVPMRTLMVFGVDRSSRATVDQGTSRTAADFLMMKGSNVTNGKTVVAVARMILIYEKSGETRAHAGWKDKSLAPTKTEIAQFAFDRVDEIKPCITNNVGAKLLGHSAPASFCNWALNRRNSTFAPQFIEQLLKGANLSESNPVYALRHRLISERLSTAERVELVFRTWNRVRSGAGLKRIHLTGSLPKLEA